MSTNIFEAARPVNMVDFIDTMIARGYAYSYSYRNNESSINAYFTTTITAPDDHVILVYKWEAIHGSWYQSTDVYGFLNGGVIYPGYTSKDISSNADLATGRKGSLLGFYTPDAVPTIYVDGTGSSVTEASLCCGEGYYNGLTHLHHRSLINKTGDNSICGGPYWIREGETRSFLSRAYCSATSYGKSSMQMLVLPSHLVPGTDDADYENTESIAGDDEDDGTS